MMKKIKGAVFDMDGTLVDSLFLWDRLWEIFGKHYGDGTKFEIREEDDRKIRTMMLKDAMDYIFTVYNIGKSGEDLLNTANELIADFYQNEVRLKDGVAEFLKYCKDRGIKMCIASATHRDYVEAAARHCGIDGYFSEIISCDDIGKGKDQPDVYLYAAGKLNTATDETCVFEDSLTAIATAHSTGMMTVGIYDRYNHGQDEIKKIADVYVAKGETLKKLIPEA